MGTVIFVTTLILIFPLAVLLLALAATRRRANTDLVPPRWSPLQSSASGMRSVRGGSINEFRASASKSRPVAVGELNYREGERAS